MSWKESPSAAEIRARVLAAVTREPVTSRRAYRRSRAIGIAAGFGLTAVIAGIKYASHAGAGATDRVWHVVSEGSAQVQPPPAGYVATMEVIWLLIAVAASWGGVARGHSLIGRSARIKWAVACAPVALMLTWIGVAYFCLESTDVAPGFSEHAKCAVMGLAFALGPSIAFVGSRRSKDPLTPGLSGAAMGAVAGTWGAVVGFPFCDCTSVLHIGLGHVVPVVVLVAMGALAGQRFLGVRPTRVFATHRASAIGELGP